MADLRSKGLSRFGELLTTVRTFDGFFYSSSLNYCPSIVRIPLFDGTELVIEKPLQMPSIHTSTGQLGDLDHGSKTSSRA
jgi:hypothetical protein